MDCTWLVHGELGLPLREDSSNVEFGGASMSCQSMAGRQNFMQSCQCQGEPCRRIGELEA